MASSSASSNGSTSTSGSDDGASLQPGSDVPMSSALGMSETDRSGFYLMIVVMSTVLALLLSDCIRVTIDHRRRIHEGKLKMLAELGISEKEYDRLTKKVNRAHAREMKRQAEAKERPESDTDYSEDEKPSRVTRSSGRLDSYADTVSRRSSAVHHKA